MTWSRSIRRSRVSRRLVLSIVVGGLVGACGPSSPQRTEPAAAPADSASATTASPATLVPVPSLTAAQQQAAEAFYRGKTVRIIVGSGAGGGFDSTARIVSRHLATHIPGAPTVIVENMPGGGGLVAANHLFFAAPKDGTVIGIFHEAQVLNQLIGAEGVRFDLRKFNWLGSSFVTPNVCLVRSDAPVTAFKDMIGNPQATAVGGTGPGSSTYDFPRVLAAATGANLKAVAGYPTTGDVRLGLERGELQGMCLGLETAQSTLAQWLETHYVRVVVQNGSTRHKDLPDVPLAADFAKDEPSRQLLRVVDGGGAMAKAFTLPPGVDADRVQVMRAALLSTYNDPVFLAEAKTMKLAFEPKTAAEIAQVLDQVLSTPPDIVARYKQISEP